MKSVCSMFNTSRMVQQYAESFYIPGSNLCLRLQAEHGQGAKDLATWRTRVAGDWDKVWVFDVKANNDEPMKAGSALEVQASVSLGPISPEDVTVELFYGPLDASGSITHATRAAMTYVRSEDKKRPEYPIHHYMVKVAPQGCGQQGFAVRTLPRNANVELRMEPGLIRWG
jgi:glycogen phosphorylase